MGNHQPRSQILNGTNTLAYLTIASVAKMKSFVTKTSGLCYKHITINIWIITSDACTINFSRSLIDNTKSIIGYSKSITEDHK